MTERRGEPSQDPESWEGLLLLKPRDEFDGAIVGRVERFNQTFIVYSRRKVLEIVAADIASAGLDDDQDPMEAALDHYGFNMNGGWYGEGTWGFLIDDED
jgi:hypothetical protein